MRVVSWNMGYWTPAHYKTRANRERQWRHLLGRAPDIALLQECRPDDPDQLCSDAMADFQVLDPAPITGSAILVRRTLNARSVPPDTPWLSYFGTQVQRAEVPLPGAETLRIASVHALASEVDDPMLTQADHDALRRAGFAKAWHNDLAASALRDWASGTFIIAGDWNTARLFDDAYPGRWPDAGKEFFDVVASWGWDETARRVYPVEVGTFRRPGTQDTTYQLDHMFTHVHLGTQLRAFQIDDTVLDEGLSDHAMLVADFDERTT